MFNELFFPASPVTSNGLTEVVLAWRGEINDRAGPTALYRRKCFGCGIIAAFVVEQAEEQIITTKKRQKNNMVGGIQLTNVRKLLSIEIAGLL